MISIHSNGRRGGNLTPKMAKTMLEGAVDRHGAGGGIRDLEESVARLIDEGEWKLGHTVYLENLAEGFLGKRWREILMEGKAKSDLLEGVTPVGLTGFLNTTGQLLLSEVRDAFTDEAFVFSNLVTTTQSQIDGPEIVPQLTKIGDVAESVAEGQVYPTYGYSESYVTLPSSDKEGFIVDITEEAVFHDLTGRVLEPAQRVGTDLGLTKEKEVIDVVIGQTNNYSRNGTANNTYLSAGAYQNQPTAATGVALVDWTSIDSAERLFDGISDPETGEPIELTEGQVDLICVKDLETTAMRIANATLAVESSNNSAMTRDQQTRSPAPFAGSFNIRSSRQLRRRIVAGPNPTNPATWWFYGMLAKAFGYKENWAVQGFQQGPDSNARFERDVLWRFKARMKGVAYAREPRYMVKLGDRS